MDFSNPGNIPDIFVLILMHAGRAVIPRLGGQISQGALSPPAVNRTLHAQKRAYGMNEGLSL